MDCVFCKIIKGEISSYKVYEDEDVFAFLDINPIRSGHVLLVPKRHSEYIFELEDPLYSDMFRIARTLSRKIKDVTKAKRVGLAIEGISVNHIHLHLVPVNEVNDLDPCLAKKADPKDLERMQSLLKIK